MRAIAEGTGLSGGQGMAVGDGGCWYVGAGATSDPTPEMEQHIPRLKTNPTLA